MLNGKQSKNHGNDNNEIFYPSNGKQRKIMINSCLLLNGKKEVIMLKWFLYPILNGN